MDNKAKAALIVGGIVGTVLLLANKKPPVIPGEPVTVPVDNLFEIVAINNQPLIADIRDGVNIIRPANPIVQSSDDGLTLNVVVGSGMSRWHPNPIYTTTTYDFIILLQPVPHSDTMAGYLQRFECNDFTVGKAANIVIRSIFLPPSEGTPPAGLYDIHISISLEINTDTGTYTVMGYQYQAKIQEVIQR